MTRPEPTRRPTTPWARVPWPACALALALWAGPAWPETPSAAEPPSIERVFIDAGGRSELEGEGRPGDVVQLLSGGVAIGKAKVGANRRWRAVLKDGLKPGTHQIRADARAGGEGPPVAGDEIRVAVPAEISRPAVVEYDGVTGETDRATRQRAEELADAAGKAYDALTGNTADRAAPPSPSRPSEPKRATEDTAPGALSVVIEWLKRSAREYRQEVVQKLGQAPAEGPAADVAKADTVKADAAKPDTPKPDAVKDKALKDNGVAADDAAKAIAAERAAAEARLIELAEAETARKASEAKAAAEAARKREERKRQQAEDLARRKAEADKRIKDELERLKKAKEDADRAKAKAPSPPSAAKVTLERFYLPGEKKPDVDDAETPRELTPRTADVEERDDVRPRAASRCAVGRVTHRKGRRWYVTGANDTLWDIAERFYGSGLAYPKIYRVNRKRLSSPHVVRPCLALRLPGRRG